MRLNLASMIDVIFLLLIFFLVSTTYTPPESDLVPALQAERVGSGAAADLQPQVVEARLVDGAPAFVLGERFTTDRAELLRWLEPLPREAGVFVKASSQLSVEWAAALLQVVRDAGFERVTYVPMP
jgi:biopolymer transport protein ExbD